MLLLFLLTVSTVFGSQGPVLREDSLNVLCSQRRFMQLGACSPHFVECNQGIGAVRRCPVRGEVFHQEMCRPAGPECHDSSISFLNEETSRLAGQLSFCGSSSFTSIFTVIHGCSRQALICAGGRSVAAACPNGYTMSTDLTCQQSSPQCYSQSSVGIRDYFLQQLCTSYPSLHKHVSRQQQQQTDSCNQWYVNCLPRPSIIRCPAGSIYDGNIQQCRPWRQGDTCVMGGSCYGREYQSVSLGKCQSVYLYCDGLQAKHLYCPEGMVFDGSNCVPPESANCPVCKEGQTRPSSTCNEYHGCQNNAWSSMSCADGTAWNQLKGECEQSYTCLSPTKCQYGSVRQISCGRALVCNGHGFDEIICPPNQGFDPNSRKCVYSTACNNFACRDGDLIFTPDCLAFRICHRGRYLLQKCQDKHGRGSGYCQGCGQPNQYAQLTSYPAQCPEGTSQAHQDDCSAYFQCSGGQWQAQRCPTGQVWSNQQSSCVESQFGQGCSVAQEPQCQEGERVLNPLQTDCSRLLECKSARWIEMTCPEGHVYDTLSKSCIPGKCPTFQQSPTIVPGTSGAQPPAPPPTDNGYGIDCVDGEQAVDPFDCTKYLVCQNGHMVAQICLAGSGYNPGSRQCEKGYSCSAECIEGTYIPLPTCGKYRYCLQGKYIDGQCNKNKMFSNGGCTEQDCQQTYYVPVCQEGSVLPSQSLQPNPAVFTVCINGRWEERACSEGHVFNFVNLVCEKQAAPLPPPTCYAGDTQAISCQEYQVCYYGEWKRQACPYGQKFVNGICVPGDCQERCQESDTAYRRDPHDCAQYYQCVHDKWMARPCAPGTVWNERVLTCDHARNVPECGGTY